MFADPGISEELAEKIVAFVDREAGRDAPLNADDEAMVRDLLEHDPAARRLAEELRATNNGLDTLLDDVAAIEVPEKLVALIRGHASNDILIAGQLGAAATGQDTDRETDAVDLRQPFNPGFGYGAFAVAASIAFFISCGALLHLYITFHDDRLRLEAELAEASVSARVLEKELAIASADVQRLTTIAVRSTDEREQAALQLSENEDTIQQLETEQATLQDRYETLLVENERLSGVAPQQTANIAAARPEREQIMADLSGIRQALEAELTQSSKVRGLITPEAEDLIGEQVDRQQRLTDLTDQLETVLQRATDSSRPLGDVQAGWQALENRLGAIEAENRELNVGLDLAQQAANEARQEVAGLKAELATSKSWLGQISQYHRVYASTARRHLVEVGADEQEHIEQWLAKMLKRPIPVPDLSSFGVTFAGARLLAVNEKPVAQLVYLDADDRPLAFCIIPSSEEAEASTLSINQDLSLVDWRDGQYGYAVVGWSDPALLASLAQAIQPIYDL